MATLFEQHSNGVPELEKFLMLNGQPSVSYGFFLLFLRLTKWEADPAAFFQILEVDRKIGWTNPAHVEESIFYFKAIKIIDDQQVSVELVSLSKRIKIVIFLELVKMVPLSRL